MSLALFRMITCRYGRILIDGIDINTIPLQHLRSKISIIPQDAVLFKGTIRDNLDPFHTLSEEELWSVLSRIHLADIVKQLPGQLEFVVVDNGENFSMGQRQLFCLGRAVVRKSKIIVMDEATASVDFANDVLIRDFVRSEFADCTVLTIAHRLVTILDSNRIAVFDAGKLVEFDTPKKLLSDTKGYLTWLVEETNNVGERAKQAHSKVSQ